MTTPRLNANLTPEEVEQVERLRKLIEARQFEVTKVEKRISLASVIRVAIGHALAMEEMLAAEKRKSSQDRFNEVMGLSDKN